MKKADNIHIQQRRMNMGKDYEKELKVTLVANELKQLNNIIDNHPEIRALSVTHKEEIKKLVRDKRRLRRLFSYLNRDDMYTEEGVRLYFHRHLEQLYTQYKDEFTDTYYDNKTLMVNTCIKDVLQLSTHELILDTWPVEDIVKVLEVNPEYNSVINMIERHLMTYKDIESIMVHVRSVIQKELLMDFNRYIYYVNMCSSLGVVQPTPLDDYVNHYDGIKTYIEKGYEGIVMYINHLYNGGELIEVLTTIPKDVTEEPLEEESEEDVQAYSYSKEEKDELLKSIMGDDISTPNESKGDDNVIQTQPKRNVVTLDSIIQDEFIDNVVETKEVQVENIPVIPLQDVISGSDTESVEEEEIILTQEYTHEDKITNRKHEVDTPEKTETRGVNATEEIEEETVKLTDNNRLEEDIKKLSETMAKVYTGRVGNYGDVDLVSYKHIKKYVPTIEGAIVQETDEELLYVKFQVQSDTYYASPFYFMSEQPLKVYYDVTGSLDIDGENIHVPSEYDIKENILHIVREYMVGKNKL